MTDFTFNTRTDLRADQKAEVLIEALPWLQKFAGALGARKLIVLTDVEGLYTSWPDKGSLVRRLSASALAEMLPGLDAGMRPKMEACWRAVEGGVGRAHVIDGRAPHSILVEVFTSDGIGTMVLPDEEPADAPFTAPIPVVPHADPEVTV